jgi:hypothetical protein
MRRARRFALAGLPAINCVNEFLTIRTQRALGLARVLWEGRQCRGFRVSFVMRE